MLFRSSGNTNASKMAETGVPATSPRAPLTRASLAGAPRALSESPTGVGQTLRALREAAGVELLSLSRASGLPAARLRAWEEGEVALPAAVTAPLAAVLEWIGAPRREAAP